MKIRCKIESMVGVNFKKLLAKVVNLIFKYILSSYFVECGWRCPYVGARQQPPLEGINYDRIEK